MFNAASRPFYQMADRVLGSQFLQDIAEFFLNFQSMYARVRRARARRSSSCCTTGAPRSRSSPRSRARRCARRRRSARELSARDFDLGALVLNKMLPEYLLSPDGERAADVLWRASSDAIAQELAATGDAAARRCRRRPARVLRTLADSFRNYEVVARREAELRTELAGSRRPDPRSS